MFTIAKMKSVWKIVVGYYLNLILQVSKYTFNSSLYRHSQPAHSKGNDLWLHHKFSRHYFVTHHMLCHWLRVERHRQYNVLVLPQNDFDCFVRLSNGTYSVHTTSSIQSAQRLAAQFRPASASPYQWDVSVVEHNIGHYDGQRITKRLYYNDTIAYCDNYEFNHWHYQHPKFK